MFTHIWVYPRCPQRPEESPGSPGTLVTDHVGAGKEPGSSTGATVAARLLSCFSSPTLPTTDIQIPENSSHEKLSRVVMGAYTFSPRMWGTEEDRPL